MSRSAITVQSLSAFNTAGTITKGTVDITNNHSIDVENVKTSNLAIFIESTTTDPMTWAIKAGDFSDSGIGDLAITSVTALTQVVVIESARFKDNDELILIDATGTNAAAKIYAVELP